VPAPVVLLVASCYGWPDRICVSGYSCVCFEIKLSGRHRGFNGVLFNLWQLAKYWVQKRSVLVDAW